MSRFCQWAGFYFPRLTAISRTLSDLLTIFSAIVRWYYLKSVHPLVWDSYPITYSNCDKKTLMLETLFKALLILSGCRHLPEKIVLHTASGIRSHLLWKTKSNDLEKGTHTHTTSAWKKCIS